MLLVSERACPQMSKEMTILHVNEAFQLSIRSALHVPDSSCIDHLLIIFDKQMSDPVICFWLANFRPHGEVEGAQP